MSKLNKSLVAKISAILLSYLTIVTLAISLLGVGIMTKEGFYTSNLKTLQSKTMTSFAQSEIYHIENMISDDYENEDVFKNIDEYYKYKNIFYTITDSTGEILSTNYSGQNVIAEIDNKKIEEPYIYDDDGNVIEKPEKEYYASIYIPEKMEQTDRFLLVHQLINIGYSFKYAIIIIGIASFILFIVLLCFLYASAGHTNTHKEVTPNFIDKIPFDLSTLITILLAIFSICILGEYDNGSLFFWFIIFIIFSIDYFIGLSYTMSIATRIKCGSLFKNTIIYKFFKACGGGLVYIFKNLSLIKKTVLVLFAFGVLELIVFLCTMHYPEFNLFTRFIIYVWIATIVTLIAIGISKIKEGADRISKGDLDYKINTRYMHGDFKEFGESLNNINNGLSKAVNEKMKSERFKTELITNVSHDIKTPLTSIINYVDLIKKEDVNNEKVTEYIDVLDRQSNRLKKLIVDLVEASKASTGNLSVDLQECEVGVLLAQTVGEFDEKLKNAGITPVLTNPETSVKIMADGRHLWRVFENLMSNVCKYSQPGTRVYMDVAEENTKVVITFKNVSKCELNISEEELMERFVRGDSSRNTEGSGLGLNIARSLVELQNGIMELVVDGDLFKVRLTFDKI